MLTISTSLAHKYELLWIQFDVPVNQLVRVVEGSTEEIQITLITNKGQLTICGNDKFLIRSLAKPNVWIYPKDNKIHIIYQDILRTITINDESVDVKNKKITWGISKVKFIDNYAILSDSKIIYIYSLID